MQLLRRLFNLHMKIIEIMLIISMRMRIIMAYKDDNFKALPLPAFILCYLIMQIGGCQVLISKYLRLLDENVNKS